MEKPEGNPSPIANILTTGDESLFKWIYKEGLGQLNLSQPIPGVCWLYCDDRAGEVADFVHVDLKSNGAPRITLIHAKGASNKSANRRVAPGPYELVSAQAMKNLRRLLAATLLKAPVGHFKFPHLWPPKLPQAGRADYQLIDGV